MDAVKKWSRYQQDIFDFGGSSIDLEGQNGMVDAVAGSGKTTTLIELTKRVKGSITLLAFNKHIAQELQLKMGGNSNAEAKTSHALGRSAIGNYLGREVRIYVDNNKGWDMAGRWTEENFPDFTNDWRYDAKKNLSWLYGMMRLNLIADDDEMGILNLLAHHGIDPDDWTQGIPYMFKNGQEIALKTGTIDFTDMIYLPNVIEGMKPRQSMWVLLDEAQDLSPAQLGLALKSVNDFGRVIAVGDPRQAIYGFAGADANSFQNIKNKIGARDLPLSICYRCPTSHLDLVKSIVPQIEPREGAPVGSINDISYDKLLTELIEKDLILCRITAPLVKLCITLIRNGRPASVRGRDIGKGLTMLMRKIEKMPGFTYESMLTFLGQERMKQMDFYAAKGVAESTVEAFRDKIECIEVMYAECSTKSVDGLCKYCESLFSDERKLIWLSTIHRAKGLEHDRIFILRPDKMMLEWRDQKAWQVEQEENLKYVAFTRSTDKIFFIQDPDEEAGGGTRYAYE